MFPHQKLDWTIGRLARRVDDAPDDVVTRSQYALHCLSKAWFHEGGEAEFNRALTQARRILQADPSNAQALVIAGISLLELDREDQAERALAEAVKLAPERADVHLALGVLLDKQGDTRGAIREMEVACRAAPDDWEAHYLLGRMLGDAANKPDAPPRLAERAQFHMVMALQRDPSSVVAPAILHDLGTSCLRGGRIDDAQKIFQKLLDHEKYRAKARYYLGLTLYQTGRFKNAIVFLRQHLEEHPDAAHVLTRIGMAYLQLNEVEKARESCNRALVLEPGDLLARWTLASALLQEGQSEEAVRVFKDILSDAPDHLPAFTELVRLRAKARDARWLAQALRAEVSVHDRLPLRAHREATAPVGLERPTPLKDRRRPTAVEIAPRANTRDRIGVLLKALSDIEAHEEVGSILGALDLTTDEGLRFQLWDAALHQVARQHAKTAAGRLDVPGRAYASNAAREILTLAAEIPEAMLPKGLNIGEEDLKRAAVERHGPASDVNGHRANIDRERQDARAWQALLLLAIAAKGTPAGRNLLVRWASDADPDLGYAARAALVAMGDVAIADDLRERARARGAEGLVDELLASVSPTTHRAPPRPVGEEEGLPCSTCGRRAPEVDHLLAGGDVAVCDRCMGSIARERRELATEDPQQECHLCGKTLLEARGVYVLRGTAVCAACVDQGLGLVEREEVDRFLATL